MFFCGKSNVNNPILVSNEIDLWLFNILRAYIHFMLRHMLEPSNGPGAVSGLLISFVSSTACYFIFDCSISSDSSWRAI